MITGSVNANHEAIIQLTISGENSKRFGIEAVVDTGFSGCLTLPAAAIKHLDLTWLGLEHGVLADGRVDLFDVYYATMDWDGQDRFIEVQALETQPLAGMELLKGYSLQINVISGGVVSIVALP